MGVDPHLNPSPRTGEEVVSPAMFMTMTPPGAKTEGPRLVGALPAGQRLPALQHYGFCCVPAVLYWITVPLASTV